MLEFIFIVWLLSRLLRPRWGYRRYYRPFFGFGWGLPLLGLFMADRWHRRPMDHAPHGSNGCGPEGFGQPHDGGHGFGGQGGWW